MAEFGATLTHVMHLDVELSKEIRPPIDDPTLNIAVPASPGGPFAHRLVTIGDSLTHGFQHAAIFNTARSWPALVAHQLGIDDEFRFPRYDPAGPGGHPLNIEFLARHLTASPFSSAINAWSFLDQVEDYYERGPGKAVPPRNGPINNNLAVWGWDLRDALVRTADTVEVKRARDQFFSRIDQSNERAAVQVLNSARKQSGKALTPLEAARELGDEPGGIETLCVWLGNNNVLGSVLSLVPTLSEEPGYTSLDTKKMYTVWRVSHFAAELEAVAAEVRRISARHVIWGTVPHVTIPPVTRGLGGRLSENNRYFRYYGRPWHDEDSFAPDVDRHLTGLDAWAIDLIIDGYNRALQNVVAQARTDGLDWRIADLCAVLDRLAVRRNEPGRPAALPPYPLPDGYADDLTVAFFRTDADGNRISGGLIGLDGIHPTTAGYGIVAQEFMTVMTGAGVAFANGATINGPAIVAADTLLSDPPLRISTILSMLRSLDANANLFQLLSGGRLPFA